jgi:hypothetical protein
MRAVAQQQGDVYVTVIYSVSLILNSLQLSLISFIRKSACVLALALQFTLLETINYIDF